VKDFLRYLVDEGFVSIHYWYKEDGLIDSRISTLKEHEPIYIELEDGGTRLIWRSDTRVYTYETTRAFFKAYGELCKSADQALLKSNKWIRDTKATCAKY